MKYLGRYSVASVLKGFLTFFYVLGFVLIAFAVFGVIAELVATPGDMRVDSFDDYSVIYHLESLPYLLDGLVRSTGGVTDRASIEPMGVLRFKTGHRGYIALTGLSIFMFLAIYMVVVVQLRNFLATAIDRRPFVRENARRIRIIGLTLIAGSVAEVIYSAGFYLYLERAFEIAGARLDASAFMSAVRIDMVLLGIVLLVIAEIFALGAALQEEQELTV